MRKIILYVIIIIILFSGFNQVKQIWQNNEENVGETITDVKEGVFSWYEKATTDSAALKEELNNKIQEATEKYEKAKADVESVVDKVNEKREQLDKTLKEVEEAKKALDELLDKEEEESAGGEEAVEGEEAPVEEKTEEEVPVEENTGVTE